MSKNTDKKGNAKAAKPETESTRKARRKAGEALPTQLNTVIVLKVAEAAGMSEADFVKAYDAVPRERGGNRKSRAFTEEQTAALQAFEKSGDRSVLVGEDRPFKDQTAADRALGRYLRKQVTERIAAASKAA